MNKIANLHKNDGFKERERVTLKTMSSHDFDIYIVLRK